MSTVRCPARSPAGGVTYLTVATARWSPAHAYAERVPSKKVQDELVGNAAAGAYVGVAEKTWSGYVARRRAPQPDRREIVKGLARPVWKRATLDAWKREQPGQGARTDLRHSLDQSADARPGAGLSQSAP